MSYIRIARAIGGLLSIVVLLGLMTVEVLNPNIVVSWPRLILMVAMISALLGVDILAHYDD